MIHDCKTVFKHNIFNADLDNVIRDITVQFKLVLSLGEFFLHSMALALQEITSDLTVKKAVDRVQKYPKDLEIELAD